jgi:hypothetical protein
VDDEGREFVIAKASHSNNNVKSKYSFYVQKKVCYSLCCNSFQLLDVKEPPYPCHISSTIEMVEGIKQIDRQACKMGTHVVGICIEEGPTMGASRI